MARSIRYLTQRARSGDADASRLIALSEEVTSGLLDEMALCADVDTRRSVASNANTSEDTLRRLVYDADISVPAALARRSDLPRDIKEALLLRVKANFTIYRGKERAHNLNLAIALCNHETTSLEEVKSLLESIQTSQLYRLLSREAKRYDVLSLLSTHPKATVRQSLLENTDLPRDILLTLCQDENVKVAEEARSLVDLTTEECNGSADNYPALKESQGQRAASMYPHSMAKLFGSEEAVTALFSFLSSELPSGTDLLELGCSGGLLTRSLLENSRFKSVTAMDISSAMLELARKNLRGSTSDQVRWIQGDFSEPIDLPDAHFDIILSLSSLHCAPDLPATMMEIMRMLKTGGLFRAVIPCLINEDSPSAVQWSDILSRFGYYLLPYSILVTELGTSGLVIDLMSEAKPVPTLSSASLRLTYSPQYEEILDAGKKFGCNMDEMTVGLLLVSGRKVAL